MANSTLSSDRGLVGIIARAALLASTAIACPTLAQDATGSQVQGEDEIIVTGSRASRQQALERKRESLTIIDAVSSDNVGKLPDYNPAEAIQRLPGVSTQLDQGEPRYAVIRGVDPNLNDVTVDGNLVGAPEAEGRRVSLDTIPSDLVAAIEVVKAVTPDMDANAVGGNINIVTPSAFDRNEDFFFASARGSYNKKADRLGYGGSATFGKRFGENEDFGVVIAASYNKRRFETDLFEAFSWTEKAPGIFAPTSIRLFDYDIMRERIGGVLNVEWRPSDDMKFYVRNIYTEFTDKEGRDQADFEIARGTQTVLSPTQLSYSRGRSTREFRRNEQTQKIYNISPGGEIRFDRLLWAFNYTHGRAEEITPVRDDIEFRSLDNLTNTIDLSGPRVTFVTIDPRFEDAANFPFRRARFRQEDIVEKLNAFRTDLTLDLSDVDASFIKFGAKFIDRDKLRDSRRRELLPTRSLTLASPGLGLPPPDDFFNAGYVFGPRVDYRGMLDLIRSDPSLFAPTSEFELINDFNLDYTITEKIYAGYAMGSVELGALTVLGGVRVERTDARYSAFAVFDADGDGVVEPSDISPLTGRNRYTDVLPSLHLKYAPGRDWQVRAAWTNTIGRPNYDQAVPTFAESDEAGVAGNPDLQPFRAMGLDLSAEFYPDQDSIVSAALFYKRIENPIFNRTTFDVRFNNLDLEQLTRPENADSGWLLGLEANLQYRFAFLPSPLDGLGFSLNGTYVKSEVTVFGREDENIPFFRQSKWIANGALFYEKGPFEARVALSYRSPYLESIGGNADEDVYFDRRTQWDAKASYRITDSLELFGSVSNFTTTSRREFQGISSRRLAEELYGPTFNFGVSANF
ncbi:TonB-dependent receptor [Leptolyngbya sp. 15MV]|nr:TonB-dependent receptor [Leptolyngbya sp. 15MV]